MSQPSSSEAFRKKVWSEVALRYPTFTHAHDPFDDPWAVDCLVLGESIGYIPAVGERVMDIGANVGIWTAFCAVGGCQVTSYEADPVTFEILVKMLASTGLLKSVTPRNTAVFSHTGYCYFKGDTRPASGGPNLRNGAIQIIGKNAATISDEIGIIPCLSLQRALGSEEWDFLKVDIEGAEFDTFLSTPLDALKQIKAMQVEFHNNWADQKTYDEVLAKLGEVFTYSGPREADLSLPSYGRLHWAKFKRI